MPPIIGAAIRFITSAPVPMDHMIGTRPTNMVAAVMNLGRSRLTAPYRMASCKSARVRSLPFCLRLVVSQVEVEEHENTGLSVNAEKGDQPDPDCDAHVIAEKVKEPESADSGERHRQQHDQGLCDRPSIEPQEK